MADEITSFSASSNLPSSSSTTINASFNNAHHFITIKLSLTNYLFWKTQITLLLEKHNLIGFVDGTYQCPHPIDPHYHLWLQQDKLIMSLLIASLSEDVFPKVIGLKTSHDIWTTLEKAFAASPSNTHQPQLYMTPQSVQQSDQSITQMDPALYKFAQDGDIDVLRQNEDQLHVQLTPKGNTLLHLLATFHDSAEGVNAVLEMKSSTIKQSMLMWKNLKGETALHAAAIYGRSKIVQALIEHAKTLDEEELESGVHIAKEIMRATDQNGDIASHKAVRNKHVEMVKLLVKEDPDFLHPSNKMEETPLYLAVESNNRDMVDSIWTTCKSPASKGPGGKTALHAAVLNHSRGLEETFVYHQLTEIKNPKQYRKAGLTKEVDEFGWTPLHYAASYGLLKSMETLLKFDRYGAYIMADKDNNMTPLHVAACNGKALSMKKLLKYCPDCWLMTTSKGQNILHLAVEYERQKALDFILGNSLAANLINEKDDEGNTPLHLYATSRNLDGKRMMEHFEADTNAFKMRNLTPLDMINRKRYTINEGEENITKDKKGLSDNDRKLVDTHLIVATLIAQRPFFLVRAFI